MIEEALFDDDEEEEDEDDASGGGGGGANKDPIRFHSISTFPMLKGVLILRLA